MTEATTSRLTVLEKCLAVVTALLALGTGFLGYRSATISQAIDQARVVAADTNNDLSSLQTKYDALQAENRRLKAQLGLPISTSEPDGPALPYGGTAISTSSNLYALASDHSSVWQWTGNDTNWIKIGGPRAGMISTNS